MDQVVAILRGLRKLDGGRSPSRREVAHAIRRGALPILPPDETDRVENHGTCLAALGLASFLFLLRSFLLIRRASLG